MPFIALFESVQELGLSLRRYSRGRISESNSGTQLLEKADELRSLAHDQELYLTAAPTKKKRYLKDPPQTTLTRGRGSKPFHKMELHGYFSIIKKYKPSSSSVYCCCRFCNSNIHMAVEAYYHLQSSEP